MGDLNPLIKAQAHVLGFDLAGITTLGPAQTAQYFDDWLQAGYSGEMAYLAKGAEKRADTKRPYPGVTSAIVVAMNYGGTQPSGPIARYARGDDYHDVMVDKLNALHTWLCETIGHQVDGKAYVDTGPILERDLARRAGLGWFGKNTNLINPQLGSCFFIGALLVALDLTPDPPFEADRCGTCTRCLDACPTQALVAPRALDATRCISYLTIELKGPIPEPLREHIGELIYGCDICQDVCPYTKKFSKPVTELALKARPEMEAPSLIALMRMSNEEWRQFSNGSPIKRAKRRGFLRNVAVALGNTASADAVSVLIDALSDVEPVVRGHAAWALGKIGTPEAHDALHTRTTLEKDESVREELRSALATETVVSSMMGSTPRNL
ncbi:MAG TPA: tRNA epoxyqueuosine(34) reductase QueG [Gemmatimonadaceae bacterium]|jgi:epoxyqueuosine reductase|nr:tRNA epoxyqueuosine(34) reductase QueG [Gemmatimonadaceae bacterium]